MLSVLEVSQYSWFIVKYFLAGLLAIATLYLLHQRVYKYWVIRSYYEKQGVKVVDQTYPLLGSLYPIIKHTLATTDPNDNVYVVAKVAKD